SDEFKIQLCDENICYDTSGDFWIGPMKTIQIGQQLDFKPQLSPREVSGTAEIVYYVLDEYKDKVDSLTVNYTSTASIINQMKTSFSVSPNPMQDIITLKGDALKNGEMI